MSMSRLPLGSSSSSSSPPFSDEPSLLSYDADADADAAGGLSDERRAFFDAAAVAEKADKAERSVVWAWASDQAATRAAREEEGARGGNEMVWLPWTESAKGAEGRCLRIERRGCCKHAPSGRQRARLEGRFTQLVRTALRRSIFPGLSSSVAAAASASPLSPLPSLNLLRAPSSASPPRLCARFLRLPASGIPSAGFSFESEAWVSAAGVLLSEGRWAIDARAFAGLNCGRAGSASWAIVACSPWPVPCVARSRSVCVRANVEALKARGRERRGSRDSQVASRDTLAGWRYSASFRALETAPPPLPAPLRAGEGAVPAQVAASRRRSVSCARSSGGR